MRVYDNGVYRDATPEEVAAWEQEAAQQPAPEPTPEERIAALEEENSQLKANQSFLEDCIAEMAGVVYNY